jgi:aspartyl-tRNA(Asn)/glutamyl-tRNA(Gln) amidotransferase subunit A
MMEAPELTNGTALCLGRALHEGTTSAVGICEALFTRIDVVGDTIDAYLHLDRERILAEAEASDRRRQEGKALSPLDGVPVAIKDNIASKGEPLTCASRSLASFVSPYDATVTERLRKAGCIPFGRLNLDEFAMGSSTENSSRPPTRNPWDPSRAPGGSSGGSAAAVAARLCPWALGSDTGGSIRQPAAFCGVIGLKPTYGRVSRYGLVAFASSLDQIGPVGRSVSDVATLLDLIDGHDPLDSTSWPEELRSVSAALREPAGKGTLGIPAEYYGEGIDPEVREKVSSVAEAYRKMGYRIREISLPRTHLAVPTYYIVATAEASSNLARFDGVRYGHRAEAAGNAVELYFRSRGEGFGPEVKRRVILGSYVLSSGYYDAYYKRAQQVRTLIRDDFLKAFEEVDAILTPTTPTPAFALGEKTGDPLSMYLADIFTIAVNLAGLPALSMPCGLTKEGLPVGFQLIGRPFAEDRLLRNAAAYEKCHPFPDQPDLPVTA